MFFSKFDQKLGKSQPADGFLKGRPPTAAALAASGGAVAVPQLDVGSGGTAEVSSGRPF